MSDEVVVKLFKVKLIIVLVLIGVYVLLRIYGGADESTLNIILDLIKNLAGASAASVQSVDPSIDLTF